MYQICHACYLSKNILTKELILPKENKCVKFGAFKLEKKVFKLKL